MTVLDKKVIIERNRLKTEIAKNTNLVVSLNKVCQTNGYLSPELIRHKELAQSLKKIAQDNLETLKDNPTGYFDQQYNINKLDKRIERWKKKFNLQNIKEESAKVPI